MKRVFASRVENIRLSCLEAEHLLRDWNVPEIDAGDIVLSIDEALTNIKMHGYSNCAMNQEIIFLEISRDFSKINIIIRDNGKSYEIDKIHTPDRLTYLDSNLVGGFGVCIIKKLMDSVTLERKNNQNVLRMNKKYSFTSMSPKYKSSKNILTKTANASIENGILKVIIKPGCTIYQEDACAHIEAYQKLIERFPEKKAFAMLIDTRGLTMITKEARKYYIEQPANGIRAIAIIVDSIFTRWLANFFISLTPDDRCVKMFSSEFDAQSWIQNFQLCKTTIHNGQPV